MLAKYNIEYVISAKKSEQPQHHLTNDPVACEEFLSILLEHGHRIKGVTHDGVPLQGAEFDKMIKTAAGMLVTRLICHSLGVDTVEAHHRFGSPA